MISILKPGLLDTIQDIGRIGYQKYGVSAGGAMDPLAHRMANLLVGNSEKEATLEITLSGPSIQFEQDALISICGGDLSPLVNGMPVKMRRPVFIKKGARLEFSYAKIGCRAYLAAAGGFAIQEVMGSKSTYLRAGIGGFDGRALKAGDHLEFGPLSELSEKMFCFFSKQVGEKPFIESHWFVANELYPFFNQPSVVRALKGPQYDWFDEKSRRSFTNESFQVSSKADRMGYRLEGPPLKLKQQGDMISEAINWGSIQVPPDGNPIILLADRQSVGGYPKIGQAASVDLPVIAQTKPGERLLFKEISHEEAQVLYIERETLINQLKCGIKVKFF